MPALARSDRSAADRSPARISAYRRAMSQCRVPPTVTGVLGNRRTSCTRRPPWPTSPTITRPLEAPRSTAASARSVMSSLSDQASVRRPGDRRDRRPNAEPVADRPGAPPDRALGGAQAPRHCVDWHALREQAEQFDLLMAEYFVSGGFSHWRSPSSQEGGGYPGVDGDEQAGGERQVWSAEGVYGGGGVFGEDFAAEEGACGVVGAEVLFGDAVEGGALGAPAAGEDAGAADDAVGVDAVDPDAVLAEFGGQEPYLVGLAGFGGAVGEVGGPGEHGVLAADVDDVAAEALRGHDLGGFPRHEE